MRKIHNVKYWFPPRFRHQKLGWRKLQWIQRDHRMRWCEKENGQCSRAFHLFNFIVIGATSLNWTASLETSPSEVIVFNILIFFVSILYPLSYMGFFFFASKLPLLFSIHLLILSSFSCNSCFLASKKVPRICPQLAIICSKLKIETLKQGVKYVQGQQ